MGDAGRGLVASYRDRHPETRQCPTCVGTGRLVVDIRREPPPTEECGRCKGMGVLWPGEL